MPKMKEMAIPPFAPVENEKTIPRRYHPPIPPFAPVKKAKALPPPDTGTNNVSKPSWKKRRS